MSRTCCLAGILGDTTKTLSDIIRLAGEAGPIISARINVTDLGRLAPAFIICDIDRLVVAPLEVLRQIRFVVPDCIIAVYTGYSEREWVRACHIAGANGVLSQHSTARDISLGIRNVLKFGCFTDLFFTTTMV